MLLLELPHYFHQTGDFLHPLGGRRDRPFGTEPKKGGGGVTAAANLKVVDIIVSNRNWNKPLIPGGAAVAARARQR